MRFYPCATPYIYSELSKNWNLYGQEPYLSWKRLPQQSKHSINFFRDLEAAKMDKILHKDLFIKNWAKTRLRSKAFLPIYYGTGIERSGFYVDTKKANKVETNENLKTVTDKNATKRAEQQGKLKRN